jgi:hypothetical protein
MLTAGHSSENELIGEWAVARHFYRRYKVLALHQRKCHLHQNLFDPVIAENLVNFIQAYSKIHILLRAEFCLLYILPQK